MIITRPLYYYASNVAEDLSRILSPHLRLKQTVNTVNPYDLTVMISVISKLLSFIMEYVPKQENVP